LAAVLIAAVAFGLSSPATADPPEQGDGLKRLEKRVADLEKEVAELRAQLKLPPKPALDNKLVGSWATNKSVNLRGLRLELDGTVTMSTYIGDPLTLRVYKGNYEVVGKTLSLNKMTNAEGKAVPPVVMEVVSVNEKELIVYYQTAEIRFERQ
jgi:hypothetical protein